MRVPVAGITTNSGTPDSATTKHLESNEYHTSGDNLNYVTEKGLNDSLNMYKKCINIFETNHKYLLMHLTMAIFPKNLHKKKPMYCLYHSN